MITTKSKTVATILGVTAITLSTITTSLQAQAPMVDPAAVKILERMTDSLGGLKKFSVHTQTTYEDELDSGQRVDYDVSASVQINRPDKLHSNRTGELVSQEFYYDGKTLSLFNRNEKVYATNPAPASLDEMFDYAREELDLIIPASDLVYSYAFSLLTENITSAIVVGKADINGITCDHLAFSRPDVDFQLWVESNRQALPCKYVVTDTTTPGRVSISTVMGDWKIDPATDDDQFKFIEPDDTNEIDFMPLN